MYNQHYTPENKDPYLWDIAKRRASFKKHITTYLIMSILFWVIWYFSSSRHTGVLPWPVWPMLGWGIGVGFHYIGAYVSTKDNSVEHEYEKLKQEQNQ